MRILTAEAQDDTSIVTFRAAPTSYPQPEEEWRSYEAILKLTGDGWKIDHIRWTGSNLYPDGDSLECKSTDP
jgi:hypothetical protein